MPFRILRKGVGMKRLLSIIIVAGLLVGAYFLLRTSIVWLDDFDGTIIERLEDEVATVSEHQTQTISTYFFEIETDDGRTVKVQVDQLQYFRASEGARVIKSPFTSSVVLADD